MEPDLSDLLTAWLGGDVPEERRATVLARLRSDPAFRAAAVAELRTFAALNVLRGGEPRWLRLEDELGWSADEGADDLAGAVAAEVASLPLPVAEGRHSHPRMRRARKRWAVAGAVTAAAAAVAIGYALWRPTTAPSESDEAIGLVVRLDGPGWAGGNGPAVGEALRPGTLALEEGSATLALFNGVTLHVEAPAEITVWGTDRVFFRRGKVRIETPSEPPQFTAQSPGATVTNPSAEFALTVRDSDTSEVAVFEGRADVSVVDRTGRSVERETLIGGQTVRVNGRVGQITLAPRTGAAFAGPIPPIEPTLNLDPGYPSAVLADDPTGYWRFETAAGGRTPNELPGRPALMLIGRATPDGPPGNRGLRFPAPTEWEQHGALSASTWTPTGPSYAVECWVMPRTVRQAVMVGLVADADAPRLDTYGVLLELTAQPAPYRLPPRTVRALHRTPIGQVGGTNQFAPVKYLPYRWYHLVAQRTATQFELYVNGELVSGSPAQGPLPPACRVLLGALYATPDGKACFHRPFVGTLDEVAVYDRALSPDAVLRHYRLGHRAPAD